MATNRTATIDKGNLKDMIEDILCDICIDSSEDVYSALVKDFHIEGDKVVIEFEAFESEEDECGDYEDNGEEDEDE